MDDAPGGRRRALADAGIDVLAAGGPRALTHRAVDVAARVPTGSTSYYFRTRRSLLEAVMQRLAELNRAETFDAAPVVAGPRADVDVALFAGQLAVVLDDWLQHRRREFLARYACLLEAAGDPDLRAVLAAGQPFRDEAAALLAALGARNAEARGRHLVAFVDGLMFDRLAGAGALTAPAPGSEASRAELADAVESAVRGLLHP